LVGGAGKDLCKDECEFEAWHVTVALDGVDALAGYTRSLRELLLGPSGGGAKLFDSIHDGWHDVKPTFQTRIARSDLDVKLALRHTLWDRVWDGAQDTALSWESG